MTAEQTSSEGGERMSATEDAGGERECDCDRWDSKHRWHCAINYAAEPDIGDVESLRVRAERFLVQCGPCDGGLPMPCACPTDDPRPVIAALLDSLAAVRREAGAKALTDYADLAESRKQHMDDRRHGERRKETQGDGRERNVWDLVAYDLRARAARIGGDS